MSLQEGKQTKLLLIGETGNGKSSLGNFILKKNIFEVGDTTKSETEKAKVENGEEDRSDLIIVDTPGLNDTNNFDTENIQNIVDCVRVTGLQGIILTMNYNVNKLSKSIKQIIETINNVLKIKDFWKHVCIVWTMCYNSLPPKKIEKDKIKKEQYKEDLKEFINQINKTNEDIDIPMYYVDSQPDEDSDNSRSEKEIESLIEWAKELELIDEKEINKLVSKYKEIRYEEKEETKTKKETKSDITYEKKTYRRCIKVTNDGKEIESEWYLFSRGIKTEKKKTFMEKVWGVVKVLGVISLGVGVGVAIGVIGGIVVGTVGGAAIIGGASAVGIATIVSAGNAAAVGAIGGGAVGGVVGGVVGGIVAAIKK
ncbi:AIG1 family protein [Entamoeba histolytica KU27]|uniref:AIG1 family protein n=1 Tax=Entamoeba histolytica KU27 TaxID=885311 RepID=M2PZM3_ENTHI|nr:AIG1 family protein [Entamoeba histolytica KU27]